VFCYRDKNFIFITFILKINVILKKGHWKVVYNCVLSVFANMYYAHKIYNH